MASRITRNKNNISEVKKRLNLGVNAFLGKFEALLGYFVTKYSFELRPSVRPSTEP